MTLPKRGNRVLGKESKRKQCLTQLKGDAGIRKRGAVHTEETWGTKDNRANTCQPPIPICTVCTKHIESQGNFHDIISPSLTGFIFFHNTFQMGAPQDPVSIFSRSREIRTGMNTWAFSVTFMQGRKATLRKLSSGGWKDDVGFPLKNQSQNIELLIS